VTNIVVLNTQAHKNVRVRARASARFGDGQRFVATVIGEFALLAVHYPILLSKDAETGAFYAGAMLGFDDGENLFLDEATGFDAYRPLNLQRAPFFAAGDDLAIDLDSPRVSETDGERLFDDDGAPTAYLQGVIAAFRELKRGTELTKRFIETLLALKLVETVTLDLAFDDGTRRITEGLYTIDQDALRALPDAAVVDLFRTGYLQLIYLMIGSLKQVPVLARRKNLRLLEA
jgi:hypothetical protein